MAKDPAFLFYPGDWQGGTMHMTHLEKGCYIDLLMLQFNRGKFTEAQAKHMLQSSFDLVWTTIQEKFICENGFYWNQRLAIEKEKRSKFTESRRNNASKEKDEQASEKHMLNHTDKRMEDENINRNINVIDIEIKEENQKFQIQKKTETIEDRKLNFAETLKPFIEKYGREFLIEFYNYWTEPNKSGKKFRQEDQNFWDLSKRLSTWEKNNKTNSYQNQPKTIQQDFANSKIGKAMQASQEADFIIDEMLRLKKQKQENESANSN
jgi:hypothetical protein